MDPLLEQFLQEARENLAFIDQNIGEIGGDDPELLNSVFRAAHTLKGGSGIVGFESVKEITHYAEDLLDMLRAGKLEFKTTMTEALYEAFDEVMNLIEAAEESGEIVDSDEEIVVKIVKSLNDEMGKDITEEQEWQVPFLVLKDKEIAINPPLNTLNGVNTHKIIFNGAQCSEEFCDNTNTYAVLFDVDESCMVYGNDPIYTLSLLGSNVLGVFSCMSENNAKSVLSGTEDEDGLLLKSHIVAYISAKFEEIEDSLFNFIDEIQLLPLDIETLLSVNVGNSGHQIDSLKELTDIAEDLDLATIVEEVKNSMELVGVETLQYAQLQRFLDIAGFINESDTPKLAKFFDNIYKGEVYIADTNKNEAEENTIETQVVEEVAVEKIVEEIVEPSEKVNKVESPVIPNAVTKDVLTGIMEQQFKAIEYIQNDDDLQRVISIMDKMKKYFPTMPASFLNKQEIADYLAKELGLTIGKLENKEITINTEVPTQSQKVIEPVSKNIETELKIDIPKKVVSKPVK